MRHFSTFFLIIIPVLTGIVSILIGPSEVVTPGEIGTYLMHLVSQTVPVNDDRMFMVEAIVRDIRLPRVLLAMMVGAALSLSGAALQGLFRNPLVSPDVLGLSSGAAFGAALALALPVLPLHPAAFAGGMAAVGLTYGIAYTRQRVSIVALILAGIIITGLFTALLTVVQFFADPFRLQTIVQWTMGNMHTATWSKVISSAPPIIAACVWLLLMRWRLNVLALGDDEARSAGLNPEREKLLILLPATLAASSAVAVAGIIGMVGLALPHLARLLVGADNRRLLPLTASLGSVFLLVVDDFSRSVATFELPVGIFTVLVGAPVFITLLRKKIMRSSS
jgi:iron complex transport system permease protein